MKPIKATYAAVLLQTMQVDRKYTVTDIAFLDDDNQNAYTDAMFTKASSKVGMGVAKRNPVDPFDAEAGEKLAMGRALEKLGKQLQKEAWHRVNGRYKVHG